MLCSVEWMSRTRRDTVVLPKFPSVEQIKEDFEAADETDPAFTAEIPLGDILCNF